jgi:hypothetical protein
MKISLVEAELFHEEGGRTDKTKQIVAFRNFEGACNKQQCCARCIIDISRVTLNRRDPTYPRCYLSSSRYVLSLRPQIHRRTASQWTCHDQQRGYLSRKHTVSQLHRPQRWSFGDTILRSYESCQRQAHEAKTQKFLSFLAQITAKAEHELLLLRVFLSIHPLKTDRLKSAWIFVTFIFRIFSEICRYIQIYIKIWQQKDTLLEQVQAYYHLSPWLDLINECSRWGTNWTQRQHF